MFRVNEAIVVDAPAQIVYELMSDLSRRAEFSPSLRSVDVVESGEGMVVARVTGEFAGREFEQLVRATHREHRSERVDQVRGPTTRMSAQTLITPVAGGSYVEQVFEIVVPRDMFKSRLRELVMARLVRKEARRLLQSYKNAAEVKVCNGRRRQGVPPLARRY